ncbi:hypothetical protein GOP47_0011708 [Adiantum capillus-veneris]|uniref:peptidylprolyl isomerase n=1 Tax=Adiantum capillus-veneris TaxID=13818 RepID=A0A9D4UT97_ADICA|nr:hypothetical protein GOP47_0011708 [Adiantum capillus-veneris]
MAVAVGLGLSSFGIAVQSASMVVSCCRAAGSPSCSAQTPSTVCVRPLPCGEACATSRRDLLGLLGAFSFTAGTAAVENLALASSPSCDFTVAPSGLGFCDTSPGTGLPPSQGMLIKANYIGKLANGKVFDSSYDRGKPLTFKIGVGQVIKGWDEGILGGEGVPPMLAGFIQLFPGAKN